MRMIARPEITGAAIPEDFPEVPYLKSVWTD